jgi:hypothetical protein
MAAEGSDLGIETRYRLHGGTQLFHQSFDQEPFRLDDSRIVGEGASAFYRGESRFQ